MSLFSSIGNLIKKIGGSSVVQAAAGVVPGPAGTALKGVVLANQALTKASGGALPNLPQIAGKAITFGTMGPGLPALPGGNAAFDAGANLGRSLVAPSGGFVTGGTLSGYHAAKDGSGRLVRNRRMNPCNPKALNRSIRRIKAFRRMAAKVERSLPKQKTTRRSTPRFVGRGRGAPIIVNQE